MDGFHANQGSLRFMLSKSKITKGETQIYSRQERSDLDTRSNQVGLRYVRCKVTEDPRSMGDVPGVPRLWIRVLEVLSSIQSGAKVTYGVDTISGVGVLPTDEDNCFLQRRNQCRVSKDRAGTM